MNEYECKPWFSLPVSALTLLMQNILPTVSAAVLLCDAVLIVPPDVHRREDERHQHGKAAEEGEDGDALLLGLGGRQVRRRHTLTHNALWQVVQGVQKEIISHQMLMSSLIRG